ncbi:ComEC/Rec2 family competence protein [Mycobacterium deserti]|uniref:Metallo-beta-lactamase domain-containing protein n=1 Tax=Mycobacterium deserti TaxID=2978347 RepID=A0ABT2MBD7_9MYCO|nr:hypothetical protein [Mycobacterium deserti]MCT7658306.1 hypothetical protein [Mycobacterium deserti]
MANKIFSLEVLPAKEGDCLVLRYGSKSKQKIAVIDGGPKGVYKAHLEDRLVQLRTELGVSEQDPMELDWIMVSHVDSDHTAGLIDLTEDIKSRRPNRFVKPARLWHNTFDDLIGNDARELEKVVTKSLGTASLTGDISFDSASEGVAVDALMVLANVGKGITLRDNAETLGALLNDGKGGLVVARADGKAFEVGDGLSFTVIGPMLDEVENLQRKHNEFLESQKRMASPLEALAGFLDPSVTNLSSLVLVAELGGKTILFTGDARGDKILEGMQLVGLGDRLHVDVLKGLHHGSDNNVTQEFFERVTADHYVFSGNGKHGNPERETLDLLRTARWPDENYKIYFTYEVDDIDRLRKDDWNDKRRMKEAKGKPPGPAWSVAKHSLAAFFDEHPDMAQRLVPLQADLPRHRIDLLESPAD